MKKVYLLSMVIALSACSNQNTTKDLSDAKEDKSPVSTGRYNFSVADHLNGAAIREPNVGRTTPKNRNTPEALTNRTVSGSQGPLPAMDQKSFEEYEEFKKWLRLKNAKPTESN